MFAARLPRLLAAFLAMALVAACTPGDDIDRSTPIATMAVGPIATPTREPALTAAPAPTAEPAPSDDAATAGGPDAAATPTVAPSPSPTTRAAATPAPDVDPFAYNLARRDDFVAQYTFEWCVGASLQMALNMATDASHTSRADQERLWEMARDRSSSPFGGANPIGWTASLNDLGIGPYRLVSLPTFDEALVVAAEAIRATRRPVGLVMWRGRHAWVMSGFESNGDPRRIDVPEITGIRVHDPLYPHGSARWGRSPKPNSLVSPATLARQFVRREGGRVDLGVPPGYLLIVPVAAAA